MIPNLKSRLYEYVAGFNADDEEIHPTLIPNRDAYDYLSSRVPLLECPDKTIEKTYYFRWWTLRKHWKDTPDGHILTEFLPPVGWEIRTIPSTARRGITSWNRAGSAIRRGG